MARPDERVIYSDINFFLLGRIVEQGQRAAARSLRAGAHLRAARDARHDVPAGRGAGAADRPDRALPAQRAVRAPAPAAIAGAADAARRRPRSDGAADGRRRRPRRPVHHRRRSGALLPHAARPGHARRRADPVAAVGRPHDRRRRRRPASPTSAASAGTSIRASRRTAASCSRSARSATPASPARRCGSIRRRRPTSSSWPTASTPTARATPRRCGRGWRPSSRRPRQTAAPAAAYAARPPKPAVAGRRSRPSARRRARDRGRRCQTGIDVLRAEGFARLAGAKVGAAHQPHRRRPRRHLDHRSAARGEEPDAGGAVQPRARHPRHAGREGAVRQGREDRPADPLALRRDAAADRRDAGRRRHDRHRPAGRRRALLHLRRDDGPGDGGSGAARHRGGRARSAQPDRRLADRRTDHATRRRSASPATCACRSATG